ncbi:MAG: ribosome assembly factor SBDS [Candidatus Marsarchaeota archaeon]|jgi:ribosome maturation protein SDO1|nr:ribosome assembly factor SBDS [Candidatus Marsarchaeota archaeon]
MSKEVTVRYTKNNETFEILVDSELVYEYLNGKRSDPLSVINIDEIFKDAKKGERQSEEKIKKSFGTTELAKVVEVILKNSQIPLTTEQRSRMIEEKRKQVINIIATNSIDPRTNTPNPPLRIENAMKEAKVTIDPLKSATAQIDFIVNKISAILPIKFSTSKVQVIIPPDAANRCYGILKRFGIKSEEWLSDGSLKVLVEFPAGMQSEFFDKINKATEGRVEAKILS